MISEYITHYFGIHILDTFTCWSSHQKKEEKLTIDNKLVITFDRKFPKNENFNIYHEKYYKISKHCVTLKETFDNHFKETDLMDVLCDFFF